jgi:O-methyltransferase involved in polyketide biosynthesis
VCSSDLAWLVEGVLIYLGADDAGRLLANVTELSAPGSRLSFEHNPMIAASLTDEARQSPTLREYTSLWKGGLGPDTPHWLTRRGWQPELHDLAALAASYQRPAPGRAHGGFLTAVRVSP